MYNEMGKGHKSDPSEWRAVAGTYTDYKEVGNRTWEVKHPEEEEEENRLHNNHKQSTTSRDDSLFHNKEDSMSRIQRNDAQDETNHPYYYQDESMNIRSVEKDNNNCAPAEAVKMPTNRYSSRRGGGFGIGLSTFWMSITVSFVVTTLILLTSNVGLVSSCNEAVCASIVSKCTLTQACKCELKNCTCCKECFDCLTYLYDECCSCVELCPRPNISHHVQMHSQVGDLKEPIDELFRALTEEKDIQGRWATFTYPIDIDQSWFMPKPEAASSANVYTVGKIVVDPTKEVVTVNCTVAYMSECMPLNKCRNSCHSMGASYFRWFHDGCCECIGSTCINYGIDESRCTRCSLEDDAEDDPMEVDVSEDTDND
ncbi:Protein twisted gastrulation [Orchesella cincta]|uniref:Protein twisted gastrulation n=1 Tax=Orchesella cincta TaxID=48709 RepID=A0A1D2MP18_ORCCI|nr:Protein twisted gastrulation [Orchesella cincta]